MKTYRVTFKRTQRATLTLKAYNKRDRDRLIKLLAHEQRRVTWRTLDWALGRIEEVKQRSD